MCKVWIIFVLLRKYAKRRIHSTVFFFRGNLINYRGKCGPNLIIRPKITQSVISIYSCMFSIIIWVWRLAQSNLFQSKFWLTTGETVLIFNDKIIDEFLFYPSKIFEKIIHNVLYNKIYTAFRKAFDKVDYQSSSMTNLISTYLSCWQVFVNFLGVKSDRFVASTDITQRFKLEDLFLFLLMKLLIVFYQINSYLQMT